MGIRVRNMNPLKGKVRGMKRELSETLDHTGRQIIGEAKRLVPVRTGKLQRSLSYEVQNNRGNIELAVGSNVKSGSPVPYAKYQEHGTRYIKAVRYMGRAIDMVQLKLSHTLRRALRRVF